MEKLNKVKVGESQGDTAVAQERTASYPNTTAVAQERTASYPNTTAVALAYDADADSAPRVVAKGKGYVAEKILTIAHAHNVPVVLDAELLGLLYQVSLHKVIPVSLYEVVAEVLAWVYSLNSSESNKKIGGLHG